MDKDMRQKCILCEQMKPYAWHQSATTFICEDCHANVELGRAVRNAPIRTQINRDVEKWWIWRHGMKNLGVHDTPEAALTAAELMEVKE